MTWDRLHTEVADLFAPLTACWWRMEEALWLRWSRFRARRRAVEATHRRKARCTAEYRAADAARKRAYRRTEAARMAAAARRQRNYAEVLRYNREWSRKKRAKRVSAASR